MSTSRTMKRAATAAAALFLATASAVGVSAKGPPDGGETAGNNLSVPAVLVPGTGAPTLKFACGDAVPETGPTAWFDRVEMTDHDGNLIVVPAGNYYLQKTEAAWQAECAVMPTANVVADWGDNLTGRPAVTQQPLRVEMTLFTADLGPMDGFVVRKLNPDELDRYATYGTRGTVVDPEFGSDATPFEMARVYDDGVRLTIQDVDTGAYVLDHQLMSAEVNSTGGIVFGFNWGIKGRKSFPQPGTYDITFETNHTVITAIHESDAAADVQFDAGSTTLRVTIQSANSGAGGGGSGNNGGGQGGGGGGGGGH